MRLVRHYRSVPADARGAVVAIGNFDGIHRGHQALIARTQRIARELGAPSGVVTFEPHPRMYFAPDQEPIRLTSFRIKLRLLESLGVDVLYLLRFDRALSGLSPEAFGHDVLGGLPGGGLGGGLGVRHVVVGDNFRFGHKRAGDVEKLDALGRESGFGVTGVTRVTGPDTVAFSSSLVREYLKTGNPTRAALLLGRYWEIEGKVRHGEKRGRGLGFPTANLELGGLLRPAYGVYAVRVAFDRAGATTWRPGVANLGIRPMYALDEPLLEVHLLDYKGDLYGKHLRVALVDYLRPEMKFDGVEALKAQMAEDSRRARDTLSWEDWHAAWPASPYLHSETGRGD